MPEQWETVTGQKGMSGITILRLASRVGAGVGFGSEEQRFELREGRLYQENSFYAVADLLAVREQVEFFGGDPRRHVPFRTDEEWCGFAASAVGRAPA